MPPDAEISFTYQTPFKTLIYRLQPFNSYNMWAYQVSSEDVVDLKQENRQLRERIAELEAQLKES